MSPSRPNPDDLLVLLEVAREGTYTRAAEKLGLNHVTISRRLAALERAVGGKLLLRVPTGWEMTPLGERVVAAAERLDDVMKSLSREAISESGLEDVIRISTPSIFGVYVAAPAAARIHQRHPGVRVEILSALKRPAQHRSGVDLEITVGEPDTIQAEAYRMAGYTIGLYASPDYLRRRGTPTTLDDLTEHRLVYYISSLLQIESVDVARQYLPAVRESVTSTDPFAHVVATRDGAGIGLLANFVAADVADLVRLLPDEFAVPMEYWLVAHPEVLRRRAVTELVTEMARIAAPLEHAEPGA
ncbi:transcriptional regulator, LysR family [Nocardia nova SH22a]|uniref:Transcriptional regulator, LysR family n=1 Tax=Nocardia nova SH22a TaxID=1415166 RepID=W5TKZ8_9NOCA|nr:LysR family transcriptional regulator [Nocardia nova]AHH19839.1 transcriptional regulator, LysR family [Nocardia nova SH22a]